MTPEQDDLRLIRECRKGRPGVFDEIVHRYHGGIYRLCLRMTGSALDAEDLAQEVFVRAYTKLSQFDVKRKFSTWLYSIATHLCLDFRRKKRLFIVEDLSEPGEPTLVERLPDQRPAGVQGLEAEQLREALKEGLLKLPDKYRVAIVLCHIEEMELKDAAKVLDLPIGTLKTFLFRGRKLLAEILKDKKDSLW